MGQVLYPAGGRPWIIAARVGKELVSFQVDTGADVRVIPASQYNKRTTGSLVAARKKLLRVGRASIRTTGQFELEVEWQGNVTHQTIFVVEGLQSALMGRPAIQALGVLLHLYELNTAGIPLNESVPEQYLQLLQGNLGEMEVHYRTALHPDAKAFAAVYTQRVPIPLLPSVRQKISRMEELGVIEKVEHATQWCALMVVARKKGNRLRICVDYKELNDQI